MPNLNVRLKDFLLSSCRNEYEQYLKSMERIETKAQNTIALSAIFIAASLAFLKREELVNLLSTGGSTIIIMLGIAILFLLLSVTTCLISFGIRRYVSPMTSLRVKRIVDDVSKIDSNNSNDEVYRRFLSMNIEKWQDAINDLAKKNTKKAYTVLVGQYFLAISITIVAIILCMIFYNILTGGNCYAMHIP